MPKPKANTDFRTGSNGLLPPLIQKFFREQPAPVSWGDHEAQWQWAYFLAEVAANPTFLNTMYQSTSPIDFPNYYDWFVDLFQADPDYFLAFMAFIRGEMKVRTYSEMSKGFLREGAVDRFRAKEDREPTDKELSAMIKDEHGVNVRPEHFGDARRSAKDEDRKVDELFRNPGKPQGEAL